MQLAPQGQRYAVFIFIIPAISTVKTQHRFEWMVAIDFQAVNHAYQYCI